MYGIARIIFMFENPRQECMFHGEFLCRSKDSILGETGDPKELFLVLDCENLPLSCIVNKTKVSKDSKISILLYDYRYRCII